MPTAPSKIRLLDTLIVGAGPAGVGSALALADVEGLSFGVVERGRIGETFRRWPAQQRFLTPSFTGNGFGATDLNAVHPETSPAFSLGVDYPSGPEYVRYLEGVARHFRVPILPSTNVERVTPGDEGFTVTTSAGPVVARTLIWAGGEFHNPRAPRMAASQYADHTSTAEAWTKREGRLAVVGGYESGLDVAFRHVENGTDVTVIDQTHPWDAGAGSDPSYRLSPRTRQRLAEARGTGRLSLVSAGHATGIRRNSDESFSVAVAGGAAIRSDTRPILATGFGPGLGPVGEFFERAADGWPVLDDNDESTITPGLFLSGPAVHHGGMKFCFVYKFRQRFAHVARVIGERLDKDCDRLEAWRTAGMLTDDLSCCGVECAC